VSAGDAETRHQSSALSTGGHGRTTDGRPVTSDVSQPPPSSPTVSTPPFTPRVASFCVFQSPPAMHS